MPDFERIYRSLEIYNVKTDEQKRILKAYFKGKDDARKEIAILAIFLVIIPIIFAMITSLFY